ncbi:DUF6471 domain-containing protein [Paracoccus fontiphilus]|uniref:DUF6471 domain-containing protein n=1 Tax=Paracoccus fontiphilus TaxID=1815556 RepID=A0ABV7IMZ3_9RHOB
MCEPVWGHPATYAQMGRKLQAIGVGDNVRNLRNKVSR